LVAELRRAKLLTEDGMLLSDPRGASWPKIVRSFRKTGVPQLLGDPLDTATSASALYEEMSVAWARHEMCAQFAEEMLDFCEDPAGACESHEWYCKDTD